MRARVSPVVRTSLAMCSDRECALEVNIDRRSGRWRAVAPRAPRAVRRRRRLRHRSPACRGSGPLRAACAGAARALWRLALRPAVPADLNSYNNGVALGLLYHFKRQVNPTSEHPLARYRYRKSATDCKISHTDTRRCQVATAYHASCLAMLAMRSRSRSRCSAVLLSLTKSNSYRSHRCRVDDRLTLTLPHRQPLTLTLTLYPLHGSASRAGE